MNPFRLATVLLGCLAPGFSILRAHDHLNAGALAPTAGSPLAFANGASFVTNSGYLLPLAQPSAAEDPAGTYAGWWTGALTLTALPATLNNGGPEFGRAALGAELVARLETVSGPAGGRIGFWEGSDGEESGRITFFETVGTTNGRAQILLSENRGEAGSDPFGHVHGRVFSADQPGLYVVGLRLVDISTNGPGGGPLHPPGEIFPIYFQAGITIAAVSRSDLATMVTYGAPRGRRYVVEAAAGVEGPWVAVAPLVTGDNHLQTVTLPADGEAGAAARFFRVRVP